VQVRAPSGSGRCRSLPPCLTQPPKKARSPHLWHSSCHNPEPRRGTASSQTSQQRIASRSLQARTQAAYAAGWTHDWNQANPTRARQQLTRRLRRYQALRPVDGCNTRAKASHDVPHLRLRRTCWRGSPAFAGLRGWRDVCSRFRPTTRDSDRSKTRGFTLLDACVAWVEPEP
jgi:hypothetical protein